MPFTVYLFATAAGVQVVRDRLAMLREREPMAWTPIRTGLQMLAEYGPDTRLNKFKRLKHTDRGAAVWEMRAQGRPAYRLLLMAVPDEEAFVVLDVVRKDDMARDSGRFIQQAVSRFEAWHREKER